MRNTRSIVTAGSRLAASALAFGLAAGTAGCGGSPEPLVVGDKAAGANAKSKGPDEAAWAEQAYPATWAAVRAFMREDVEFEGRSIGPVTALYRPGVEGAAYLHFALRRGSEEAGHIVASTGGHAAPIHSWSFTGSGEIRSFEKRVGRDLSAARVFLVGVDTFVAELPDGPISSDGSPLAREQWEAAKPQLVRALEKGRVTSRERTLEAWQRAAKVTGTDLPPDLLPLCPTDGCGGDPCLPGQPGYEECICGGVSGTWRARGGPPPEYVQFFNHWWNGYCKSGCTPTAFAQIMGWIARQSGDHSNVSVWGHPRMAYAYANGSYVDSYPPSYTEWRPVADLHETFETTCVGDTGSSPFWPPDDRVAIQANLYLQALGAPVQAEGYSGDSWEYYHGALKQPLYGKPIIVNAMDNPWGENAHTWVVFGYRKSCFGEAVGVYKTSTAQEGEKWISFYGVIDLILNPGASGDLDPFNFGGVVLFNPTTTRDHGPITTGAGSGWCLDVLGASGANGAWAEQYGCHGGNSQLWYLDRTPGMTGWRVRNRHTGKCLAPWDGGSYNGAQVVQWTCDPNDVNELWGISKRGSQVVLKHNHSQRCLDLDNAGGMAGYHKKIQMWDCNEGTNQRFDFAL